MAVVMIPAHPERYLETVKHKPPQILSCSVLRAGMSGSGFLPYFPIPSYPLNPHTLAAVLPKIQSSAPPFWKAG